MTKARFSIRTAVAEGFEFWREHWRKAAGPLALAGIGASLASFNDPGLLMIGAGMEFVALILAHAVYYRIALADLGAESVSVNGPLGFQWARLEGRLLAMNLLIALIYAVAIFICAFMVMVLLAGASQDTPLPEMQGMMTPQEVLAVLSPPQQAALLIGFVGTLIVLLLIWARLSMAAPTPAATGTINVLGSVPLTRGSTFRLAGLWLVVRMPVFLLAMVAAQFGLLVGDPVLGVVATLLVGLIGVFFVQPILVGGLAYAYRQLSRTVA